jgi:maleate isomerase
MPDLASRSAHISPTGPAPTTIVRTLLDSMRRDYMDAAPLRLPRSPLIATVRAIDATKARMNLPEYGTRGLVGVLPPQANTNVEAEFSVLLPADVACATARLTCYAEDSRARLMGYFENVGATLRQFDTASPAVIAFACTGSTYFIGLEAEQVVFDRFAAERGAPIVSAAGAVRAALDELGARRIALVSPYPPWLTEACAAFWRAQGREIADVRSPAGDRTDTRRIYALGSADGLAALDGLEASGVDAVVVTGTGMPSLGIIARSRIGVPVLSSNLCLAWRAMQVLGDATPLAAWLDGSAGWRERLAARFPGAVG